MQRGKQLSSLPASYPYSSYTHNQSVTPLCTFPIHFSQSISYPFIYTRYPYSSYTLPQSISYPFICPTLPTPTINQLPLYVPILFLFIFHNQSVTPLCTPSLPIYFPQPISYPFTFPSSSYTLFTIYQLALYVPLLLLFNFHINLLPLYAPLYSS